MNKFQRFKEGLKNLTPLQQLNAKAAGHLWGSVGLTIALCGMVYSLVFIDWDWVRFGFSIFVFFLIYTQITSYIGTKQQIEVVKEAEEKVKEMEILNKL